MADEYEYIRKNLTDVHRDIELAAIRSGRKSEDITLIAVSKTVDIPAIESAAKLGMDHFGENRVQEYLRKEQILSKELNWHFIGRIQTNKVKLLAGKDVLIHSLDRVELLNEMGRVAHSKNVKWRVLIEVNVANEKAKAGVSPQELLSFVQMASASGVIEVLGLMTVAPYDDNPENSRIVFRQLKELSIDIKSKKLDNVFMRFLSMGMSNDFIVAIEEGATHVRVGTAIFGKRDYSK